MEEATGWRFSDVDSDTDVPGDHNESARRNSSRNSSTDVSFDRESVSSVDPDPVDNQDNQDRARARAAVPPPPTTTPQPQLDQEAAQKLAESVLSLIQDDDDEEKHDVRFSEVGEVDPVVDKAVEQSRLEEEDDELGSEEQLLLGGMEDRRSSGRSASSSRSSSRSSSGSSTPSGRSSSRSGGSSRSKSGSSRRNEGWGQPSRTSSNSKRDARLPTATREETCCDDCFKVMCCGVNTYVPGQRGRQPDIFGASFYGINVYVVWFWGVVLTFLSEIVYVSLSYSLRSWETEEWAILSYFSIVLGLMVLLLLVWVCVRGRSQDARGTFYTVLLTSLSTIPAGIAGMLWEENVKLPVPFGVPEPDVHSGWLILLVAPLLWPFVCCVCLLITSLWGSFIETVNPPSARPRNKKQVTFADYEGRDLHGAY